MPRQKRKHDAVSSEEETINHEQAESEISNEKLDNETANYDDSSSDEIDDLLLKPANIFTEERTQSPRMSKRPRIANLDALLDSPCRSSDIDPCASPSISVQSNDSDSSHVDVVNLHAQMSPSPNSPEIIDLSTPASRASDVVDLTAEPTTPTQTNDVVDLTEDITDSSPITIVSVNKIFERPRSLDTQQVNAEITVNTSNDASSGSSSSHQDDNTRHSISCPICFDDIHVLKRRKRQLHSTVCGHVFCDKCIKNAIKTQSKCPTCRKKLTMRQIHPLFL